MAYVVFNSSEKNSIVRLCKDLTELNEKPLVGAETSGEIPDEIFNDLISFRKDILNISNGVITTSDHIENMDQNEFIKYRSYLNKCHNDFCQKNPSSSMVSKINSYLDKINGIELSTINFPLTISLNQYLLENGIVESEQDLFEQIRLY